MITIAITILWMLLCMFMHRRKTGRIWNFTWSNWRRAAGATVLNLAYILAAQISADLLSSTPSERLFMIQCMYPIWLALNLLIFFTLIFKVLTDGWKKPMITRRMAILGLWSVTTTVGALLNVIVDTTQIHFS